MKYKRAKSPTAIVHDHFDGSAFCIECAGECKLTGTDLYATQLTRAVMEQVAIGYFSMSIPLKMTIKESIGSFRFDDLMARAQESMADIKRMKPGHRGGMMDEAAHS